MARQGCVRQLSVMSWLLTAECDSQPSQSNESKGKVSTPFFELEIIDMIFNVCLIRISASCTINT